MYNEIQKFIFFNGYGGFTSDGTEYAILLDGENRPPAPWINVISNGTFGFTISESGAGYTWAYNSRENKLTPWSNDPVLDSCPEVIYIRDEVTGRIFTPVSLGRRDRGLYSVKHGFGYTNFHHDEEGLEQRLTVFTPAEEPLKIWELVLTNHSDRSRHLTLTYYVEWTLGVNRDQTGAYIITGYDNENEYLYAKNIYNYKYRKHQAFIFSNETIIGYTGNRQEVLGLKGSVCDPRGLGVKLSCNTGACYDSCGAIQISAVMGSGESKAIIFGLGYSDDKNEIQRLLTKYRDAAVPRQELSFVKAYWKKILGAVQIETSDKAIDILVNGWLLYQTISCRIFARTAFYQCGGAYGFRDQLQDALALVYARPDILRDHIKRSSERQFREGDVQHWWHPPEGLGVRTRISDDLLWLPYATAEYVRSTGDYSVLFEKTMYIDGPQLEQDQHENMFLPKPSDTEASIYEHCKNAIKHIRFGAHGLPLIGGGDWNDGMNKVGIGGTGESVWLGWFMIALLEDFIPLCRYAGDQPFADELEQMRENLINSIEEHAWDGEWYIRAFYDDGSKLGSRDNDECRIDSISQSWSIISKGARPDRAIRAFQSAWNHLFLEKDGISLLLTPPFNKTSKNPGYIKKYYPGIRENGGQYTHGAIWLAIAAVMIGDKNKAYSLFSALNPIHLTRSRKDVLKYEKEPYVMTADISYNAPYTGKGGWSWYTGSAGWMYQGLVKWFLGLHKQANHLVIAPAVPISFGDYKIRYKYKSSVYNIDVIQKNKAASEESGKTTDTIPTHPEALIIDGELTEGNRIKLKDDGKHHHIIVWLQQ